MCANVHGMRVKLKKNRHPTDGRKKKQNLCVLLYIQHNILQWDESFGLSPLHLFYFAHFFSHLVSTDHSPSHPPKQQFFFLLSKIIKMKKKSHPIVLRWMDEYIRMCYGQQKENLPPIQQRGFFFVSTVHLQSPIQL